MCRATNCSKVFSTDHCQQLSPSSTTSTRKYCARIGVAPKRCVGPKRKYVQASATHIGEQVEKKLYTHRTVKYAGHYCTSKWLKTPFLIRFLLGMRSRIWLTMHVYYCTCSSMDARAHVVPHAKGNLTTAPPCRTSNLATRMLVTFGISKTTMPPSLGRTGDKAPVEEPTKSMLSKVCMNLFFNYYYNELT